MDFIDKLKNLASNAEKRINLLQTEEATKNSLVLPFLRVLGYDYFDPTEVIPEYTADVGQKKGEKVDYAIIRDGKPILLIECKVAGSDLTEANASQLYRYFTSTPARFGILTNGRIYRFYSDLEDPNKMDSDPFMEFDLFEDITQQTAASLKIFEKSAFDLESSINAATNVKYNTSIKNLLSEWQKQPSDGFVRFILSHVYSGTKTKKVRDSFTKIVGEAFREFINDQVQKRLKKALENEIDEKKEESADFEAGLAGNGEKAIVTTDEEKEGYFVVKSVLIGTVDPGRVFLADRASYCNILLDNKRTQAICRFRFDSSKKTIEIPVERRAGPRIPIETMNCIYGLKERLVERAEWLLSN